MLSYRKYKNIYPDTNVWKWIWNQIPLYVRRMYRIPYCTYMCIRYPFLYPRNRFTDKHTVGLLSPLRSKLYNSSIMEVVVTGKLEKENKPFTNTLSFAGITAKLDISDKKIIITNNIEQKVYDLTNLLWKDNRFEILGISPFVSMFSGNPTINVHVRTKDENDETNYGFSYDRVFFIKNRFKNKLYKFIKWFDEKILDKIFVLPISTEWDAVEPGWNKAFGKQYLKELKAQIKKDKIKNWRITQIKEKWGCYDKETEVLTKSGWKLFSDVSMDDEFATLNSEHYLEYHKPIDIISYKYNGLLYHLENRDISLKVTPNHNLYVSKGSYFNGNKDNLKVTFPFELCTPDKYFGKDKRFLKGCNWKGQTPEEYFKIPDYTYKHTYQDKRGYEVARTYTKIGPTIEIKAFLKFLGFYIAEGYTYIKVGKNGAHISVAYNPADEKELVTELIKNIGFEWF